jgi:hypothetical protein
MLHTVVLIKSISGYTRNRMQNPTIMSHVSGITDIMVIQPVPGRQILVCDKLGHH